MEVPTLLISGTVGVGKSTVAAEINDVLAELRIPNAAVDLDGLTWHWPSSSKWNDDLMFENLASLWPNYRRHGATHLVVARVVEERRALVRYEDAVPGAAITVCRLTAPASVRVERLGRRMPPGPSRDWHVARSAELERILTERRCEDFTIENDDRPVRTVAVELLLTVGWIGQADAGRLASPSPGS
jgi:predicted kinase